MKLGKHRPLVWACPLGPRTMLEHALSKVAVTALHRQSHMDTAGRSPVHSQCLSRPCELCIAAGSTWTAGDGCLTLFNQTEDLTLPLPPQEAILRHRSHGKQGGVLSVPWRGSQRPNPHVLPKRTSDMLAAAALQCAPGLPARPQELGALVQAPLGLACLDTNERRTCQSLGLHLHSTVQRRAVRTMAKVAETWAARAAQRDLTPLTQTAGGTVVRVPTI